MVPMFTCGLVRSNLALATVGPPQDSVALHPTTFHCRMFRKLVCIYVSCALVVRRLLALVLLNNLISYRTGNLRVTVERHRVHRATRGLRPQVTDITEHFRQRY